MIVIKLEVRPRTTQRCLVRNTKTLAAFCRKECAEKWRKGSSCE
jgi:hypothetical protein